jgi:hypothetical protein
MSRQGFTGTLKIMETFKEAKDFYSPLSEAWHRSALFIYASGPSVKGPLG